MKKKKLMKCCLISFLTLEAIMTRNTVKVQADSSMEMLYEGVTYTQYDFDGDGQNDSFECVSDSERGYIKIYINGEEVQKIFITRGANLYGCVLEGGKTYLLAECSQYGRNELKAYTYTDGKFISMHGKSTLNKMFPFARFSGVQGDSIYVRSTPGTGNIKSFKNIAEPITTETEFKIKDNEISCVSWDSKITGANTFYAQNSFQTSASEENLDVKDGPQVESGQEVELKYVKFSDSGYIYHIIVDGQEGCFKDSEEIMLTSNPFWIGNGGNIHAASMASVTGYPEYDKILNKYYSGICLNWNIKKFQKEGLCYLAGYDSGVDKIGYYLRDVDNDGTDELFIGSVDREEYAGMFYDFYTILNGKCVQVASSSQRDKYFLCKNNKIANEGVSGQEDSFFHYYDYAQGKFTTIETVFTDGQYDEQNPWFYTTADSEDDHSAPITEEKAQSVISRYEHGQIPYIPLVDLN